jgi:hypothetical protein
MNSPDEIEQDKGNWYNGIVDTIFQEWIGSGGQEFKMAAEQNERSDVPTHDKYAKCCPYNGRAHGIYSSQVFRRQEKRVSPESDHERTIYCAEQEKPKQQQDLEFLKMQDHQLHREGIIYRSHEFPHKIPGKLIFVRRRKPGESGLLASRILKRPAKP